MSWTLPAFEVIAPPRARPSTDVFFALARVSASPKGLGSQAYWVYQSTLNRVSGSSSPSCSESTSSSTWLMRARAVFTDMDEPSDSTTRL